MFKRAKFLMLAFFIVFINFLTLDFLLIDVEKTALIVAIGIDKTELGYEVTAQIAVPEATNQSTKSNEAVIYASGKTIYDAIDSIGSRTGWYPKLSFCNLIILGNSIAENENVMGVVDFFVRSYKVEDSAILCASEKSAKELLLSISPLDNVSSFALTKIFVRDNSSASAILTTTIKEFAKGYYSNSKCGYMPMVKTIETKDNGDNTSSASSVVGTNTGSSDEKKQKNTPVVYSADTCLLFNNGVKTGVLSGDECLFYSLLYKRVNEAFFPLDIVDDNGNSGTALIGVRKANSTVKLDIKNGAPVLKCNLKLWLKLDDSDFPQSMQEIATLGKLNDKTLERAKLYALDMLGSVFEKSVKANADIFRAESMLYRFHTDSYDKFSKDLLNKLVPEFKVTCLNYI